MGRSARTLGVLVLLGSLGSCGTLTHKLWTHGGTKHWTLEEHRFEGQLQGGGREPAGATLVVTSGDDALRSGWQRLARENALDLGDRLELRGGPEAHFLVAALGTPVERELGARLTVGHHRDGAGKAATHAVLAARGILSTYDTVRPGGGEDAAVPLSNLTARTPSVDECLAAPGFEAWRAALGCAGAPLRWLGVRTDAAAATDPAEALEAALRSHDLEALRRLWLRVAWSKAGREECAELRADALDYAKSTTCSPGNGYVAWSARASFVPTLTTAATASRPASGTAFGRDVKVDVSLQRKELVRREGLGTTARVALTPLTVTFDVATLGAWILVSLWLDNELEEDDVELTTYWVWSPKHNRWVQRVR